MLINYTETVHYFFLFIISTTDYFCSTRSSAKRTQVIDDESDYFNADSNRWLSKAEKEKLAKRERELREKRHASRLDRKVTLDFAGRRVVDTTETVDMYNVNDDVIQEVCCDFGFVVLKSFCQDWIEFYQVGFAITWLTQALCLI